MKNECTNKELGVWLHAYEISALNEEMTETFEKHILTCNSCFEQLQYFNTESMILKDDNQIKNEINNSYNKVQLHGNQKLDIRTIILAAIIVLMVYPAYKGLTSDSPSIRTISSIQLVPVRSASNNYSLQKNNDLVISFVVSELDKDKKYFVELLNNNKIIYSDHNFSNFDNYNTGRLLIPQNDYSAGAYKLRVLDQVESNKKVLQQYNFQIN